MTADEHAERDRAAQRAGPNFWGWKGVSFRIVENTLDLADLDPIARNIQPEFVDVEVSRRVAGPMAGGLMPEAALLLVLGPLAVSFLTEAGKDAYKGFRTALFAAYRKARTWANDRGYARLTVEIAYATGPSICFVFPSELDADKFELAMQTLLHDYSEIDRTTTEPHMPIVMEWHPQGSVWRRNDS